MTVVLNQNPKRRNQPAPEDVHVSMANDPSSAEDLVLNTNFDFSALFSNNSAIDGKRKGTVDYSYNIDTLNSILTYCIYFNFCW